MYTLILTLACLLLSGELTIATGYQRACDHPFFCNETYLEIIGSMKIFEDSKSIVDLELKDDFENIRNNFDNEIFSKNLSRQGLSKLMKEYFEEKTYFTKSIPCDWNENPAFLSNVKDSILREWGHELNKIWLKLYRKVDSSTFNHKRSSFLPIPNGTMVPGGRFKEIYYWDSYFICLGLITCDMPYTTEGIILNMLYFVERYGFVPNGGRIYYTRRSQPPFLTLVVEEYIKRNNNMEFVNKHIHTLDREYNFWVKNRSITFKDYTAFLYKTDVGYPRPESCIEDIKTAKQAYAARKTNATEVYVALSSAAESGWDFSSRWFKTCNETDSLSNIHTHHIIPVCLNSILCKVAQVLMVFHEKLGNNTMSSFYKHEVERIRDVIHDLMWNNVTSQWNDYNYVTNSKNTLFYGSNYFPLWANCHKLTENEKKLLLERMINSEVLTLPGGFPTSIEYTSQQWDHPAAWPPLQYIMVEALNNLNSTDAENLAFGLAQRWVVNNYKTYIKENKVMFEKYNAVKFGRPGGGGEYKVQDGFGWTNGVALKFLNMYGDKLTVPSTREFFHVQQTGFIIVLEISVLCLTCVMILIIFKRYRIAKK